MSFHSRASLGARHPVHNYEYADSTARLAATGFTSDDIGKVALQLDDLSLWYLSATTPTWTSFSGLSLSSSTPGAVAGSGSAGASGEASRADHVHAHGSQTDGSHHAVATTSVAGFLSAADKTKLDGIATGAEVNAVDSVFGRTGAVVAVAGDYAASEIDNDSGVVGAQVSDALDQLDGDISTHIADTTNPHSVTASQVGAPSTSRALTAGAGLTGGGDLSADRTFDVVANADGSIVVNANDIQVGVLASDAQHGNLGGGSLHAAATTSVAGFLSATDKAKLDGIAASAAALTSSAPADVTKAAAAVGVATTAARADHKHDISTAAAGSATPGDAAAEGTATSLARSDHVHALPAFGSSSGTFCQGNDARLSDARAPTGSAGGQLSGTYPNPSVAGITETSGPDALTVGSISDTQLLVRSGTDLVGLARSGADSGAIHVATAAEISAITEKTTLVGDDLVVIEDSAASNAKKRAKVSAIAALAAGGGLDALGVAQSILMLENFPRNGNSSSFGQFPWGSSGSISSNPTAPAGMWGVIELTAAIGGNRTYIQASNQDYGSIDGTFDLYWEAMVRPRQSIDAADIQHFYLGLATGNVASGSAGANFTSGIVFLLNAPGRWDGITRDGGSSTTVPGTAGSAPAVDTWVKLAWAYTYSGTPTVEFFVDDVSIGTSTTNIYTSPMAPCLRIATQSSGGASDIGVQIDYMYLLKDYAP